jgi:drug/metabolite transporter (DMT)-like permease
LPLINQIKHVLPYIILLVALVVWAALPSFTKIALSGMSVISFIAIRFIFSSILMAPFLKQVAVNLLKISARFWLVFILTISIMFGSQTFAVSALPVSWYIVIFSATPILIALCLRYRFNYKSILGLALVFLGLIFFFLNTYKDNGSFSWIAIFCTIIGMFSWVFYSVLIKHLHKTYNDVQITALTTYLGAIASLIAAFFLRVNLASIHWHSFLITAVLGLILPLAFFCYSYSIRYCQGFAIFGQYLEPIFGVIIAIMIFGNSLNFYAYVAAAIVLAGVAITTRYHCCPV